MIPWLIITAGPGKEKNNINTLRPRHMCRHFCRPNFQMHFREWECVLYVFITRPQLFNGNNLFRKSCLAICARASIIGRNLAQPEVENKRSVVEKSIQALCFGITRAPSTQVNIRREGKFLLHNPRERTLKKCYLCCSQIVMKFVCLWRMINFIFFYTFGKSSICSQVRTIFWYSSSV